MEKKKTAPTTARGEITGDPVEREESAPTTARGEITGDPVEREGSAPTTGEERSLEIQWRGRNLLQRQERRDHWRSSREGEESAPTTGEDV